MKRLRYKNTRYICQNKKCKNTWSTYAGYTCPKCGTVHKIGKGMTELVGKMYELATKLALKDKLRHR